MSAGLIVMSSAAVPEHAPAPPAGETAWVRGDRLPVQIGVYKRLALAGVPVYSFFDGDAWHWNCSTPAEAVRAGRRSLIQNLPWCGLVEPPDGGYGKPAAWRCGVRP